MFGPMDFVLGGLTPLAAAALAFALVWRLLGRGGPAWAAGVVVGFAAGIYALEVDDVGPSAAAWKFVRATESLDWLPLVALCGILPAAAGRFAGRQWVEPLLAAPLCVAAPLWLLGGKYRASQQLREAGFADDAITPGAAAGVLAAIAVGTLAAWLLWRRGQDAALPKTRSLLAIIATVGTATAAGLTGALVYAQTAGVLAAALGGCAAAAWLMGEKSGPEAAPGPTLLAFAGLLALGATYSSLQPWQAATLALAFALPVGWLPGLASRRPLVQAVARTVLCVVPLALVLWQAAATFIENERQQQLEQADDEPYFQ